MYSTICSHDGCYFGEIYLLLVNVLAHIIGFLIRAITYQPALIVVSSFLSGGGHYAVAYYTYNYCKVRC